MSDVSIALAVAMGAGIIIGGVLTWLALFFMGQHLDDLERSAYGGNDE